MTPLEKNLVLGRLGQTRETHKGSPTVLVEPTMDDASGRTGIVPDHKAPDGPHHESVLKQLTSRLGLPPGSRDDPPKLSAPATPRRKAEPDHRQIQRPRAEELVEDEAQAPAEEASSPRTETVTAVMAEPEPACESQDAPVLDEAPAEIQMTDAEMEAESRRKLTEALRQLELDMEQAQAEHHDEQTDPEQTNSTPHRRKRRRRKRRKHGQSKRTFRICSRTLRCLKAYSRVTGRWQYDLVGEALESYLELAITALDSRSLEDMRAILKDLHEEN